MAPRRSRGGAVGAFTIAPDDQAPVRFAARLAGDAGVAVEQTTWAICLTMLDEAKTSGPARETSVHVRVIRGAIRDKTVFDTLTPFDDKRTPYDEKGTGPAMRHDPGARQRDGLGSERDGPRPWP
jgi:hypothetical protein